MVGVGGGGDEEGWRRIFNFHFRFHFFLRQDHGMIALRNITEECFGIAYTIHMFVHWKGHSEVQPL
jgi:hypothetical protein